MSRIAIVSLWVFGLCVWTTEAASLSSMRQVSRIRQQQQTVTSNSQGAGIVSQWTMPAKVGTFATFNGDLYRTDSANTIYRWGWAQQAGGISSLSFDGTTVCGINQYNNLFCSKASSSGVSGWVQLTGTGWQQTVIKGTQLLAVSNSNVLSFGTWNSGTGGTSGIGSVTWTQVASPSGVGIVYVAWDGTTLCAVSTTGTTGGGNFYCSDSGLVAKPSWRLMAGGVTNLSVFGKMMLAVNSYDNVFIGSYSTGTTNPNWVSTSGNLRSVTYDPVAQKLWGIDSKNNLFSSPYIMGNAPSTVTWTRQ